MSTDITIHRLAAAEALDGIDGLADVLVDCVEGGASVSFMLPLARDKARAFWRGVAEGVGRGERLLLAARQGGRLVGTVQLVLALPENQPHRADVAKMLVHRDARRRGIGARLLAAVDDEARREGRSLLVLDTVTGSDAERLYRRCGWQAVGSVPDYALWPAGGLCATTFFYKRVEPAPPHAGLLLNS